MIVSIHQPDYISYLGYFYKISKSDVFVYLDDAQFSNDNMHHWNRIKTPQGECRLKVPVEQHLGDAIPYFDEIFPKFKELLCAEYPSISEMNIAINTWIAQGFGFEAKMYKSSDLPIHTVREERVIDIVKHFDGDTYISGNGAKAYQVDEHFSDKGIDLVYTDYKPIEYPQLWKKAGFLPYMSTLDYLMNCGFDWQYVENAVKEMNSGDR